LRFGVRHAPKFNLCSAPKGSVARRYVQDPLARTIRKLGNFFMQPIAEGNQLSIGFDICGLFRVH
jgi:hypothetical protein